MIPTQAVYKPGICWSMIPDRGGQHPMKEHLCAAGANQYQVIRKMNNASVPAIIATMWLCDYHAEYMRRKGYVVIKLPSPSVTLPTNLPVA